MLVPVLREWIIGREAHYIAIPEDCELLVRARQDRDIAELTTFITWLGVENYQGRLPDHPNWLYVFNMAQNLYREVPGLGHRYYKPKSRYFDAILYLLSPERRKADSHHFGDRSLIDKTVHGCEPLCPGAIAGQGEPLGFVPTIEVPAIADYLESVTTERLHEHYDPVKMVEARVYKMFREGGEEAFHWIWEEFTGMRDLYRAAANHNEAVITCID